MRCFKCKWFKGESKVKHSGWCVNPAYDKKMRVQAVDYCSKAEAKGGEGERRG